MLLSYLGNGKCGCNGYCTCNEGFSGDICECGPGATKCSNFVGEEVSSLCVCNVLWFIYNATKSRQIELYRTLICYVTPLVYSFALDTAAVCVVCAPVTQVMLVPTVRCAPQQR